MVAEYCKNINNFALYLNFAKNERYLFNLINKNNRADLCQIIALSALEGNSEKEINRILKREMYYFATRILGYRKIKEKQVPYSQKGMYLKKKQVCDLCGKESNHAHYKSFIPGKCICRLCYNNIKRKEGRKNNKLLPMFKITETRLKELGFSPIYLPENSRGRIFSQFEYSKDSIVVGRNGKDFYVNIYVPITTASDYASKAKGVKTEEDLITLCRLIDG